MNSKTTLTVVFALIACISLPLEALAQRQMEKLGRGLVAVRKSDTQVYLGWRMLGGDPDTIAFNLYRQLGAATAQKINDTPITATTDYLDTLAAADFAGTITYSVRAVVGGAELTPDFPGTPGAGSAFTLPPNAERRQYFTLPLSQSTGPDGPYTVKFCWVGDLDGDGEYDFVLDRHSTKNPAEEEEEDEGEGPVSGYEQFLEGYKRDGTLLWRLCLGPNSIAGGTSSISQGAFENVTVYDLDGDGRAEVIIRAANGVRSVNPEGAELSAITDAGNTRQFVAVFDGFNGQLRAHMELPNAWAHVGPLNNRLAIACLDGVRPSVVFCGMTREASGDRRHFYTFAAFDYRDGALTKRWELAQDQRVLPGAESHSARVADVDNDGRDEICDIGHVIDDNGQQLYHVKGISHGDRYHISDIDPDSPGLETYVIQQNNGAMLACALYSSASGEYLKKWFGSGISDIGRGLSVDMVPDSRGYEMFSTQSGVYSAKGDLLYTSSIWPSEGLWWDADLGREFIGGTGSGGYSPIIDKFDPATGGTTRIRLHGDNLYSVGGDYSNRCANGGRPAFWGDILGDWREELVLVTSNHSAMRIFVNDDSSQHRMRTLMHNPQYRAQTTTKGYVQGSYVDFYLGFDMPLPAPPPMTPASLTWTGSASSDWNTSAQNWLRDAVTTGTTPSPASFGDGESVLFGPGGASQNPVVIAAPVAPSAVTVYSPNNYAFSGPGTLTGAMTLTKAGAGSLTLENAHDFSGGTTVWDGALVVNNALNASPVEVWGGIWGGAAAAGRTGGRLEGSGTIGGRVTINELGALSPGTASASGTLTLDAGLVTVGRAVLIFDAGDLVAVKGDITLSGRTTVIVNSPDGSMLAPGDYPLITCSGGTVSGDVSTIQIHTPEGTPYAASLDGAGLRLNVPVTRGAASVTWAGGVNNDAWDIVTSANWTGADGHFVAGDSVVFDDAGAAHNTVTLTRVLPVASVNVSGTADYLFTGDGAITGTGGLVKSGPGALTLATRNTYAGPTVINGGVLVVTALGDGGEPGSLGTAGANAGNLVFDSGTLRSLAAQANSNRNITIGEGGAGIDLPDRICTVSLSGTIFGPGALRKTGTGTLVITGTNTYQGGTVIEEGTVSLGGREANTDGLGTGPVTLRGGTLTMADVRSYLHAKWPIEVPAGCEARLNADGRCTIESTLTGSGTLNYYSYYVRTDLAGDWTAFAGRISALGGEYRMGHTGGLPSAELHLTSNGNVYWYQTTPENFVYPIGALSGEAGGALKGGATAGRTMTYQIGAKGLSTIFAGSLRNGSGPTAVEKVGAGALTLSGTNAYTGPTTVTAGSLIIDGELAATAVTVKAGATLGGSGTHAGSITMENNSMWQLPGTTDAGLVVAGPITISGTVMIVTPEGFAPESGGRYSLFTTSGTVDKTDAVFVWAGGGSGSVDVSTDGEIAITFASVAPTITSPLTANGSVGETFAYAITASNNPVSFGAMGLPDGLSIDPDSGVISGAPTTAGTSTVSISATNGAGTDTKTLTIYIEASVPMLIWTGAVSDTWDAVTQNWKWSTDGSASAFIDGEIACFDDTSASAAIVISDTMSPMSIVADISGRDIVLSSSSTTPVLGGTPNLVKRGTSLLKLSGANTLVSGTTTLEAGVLQIENTAASYAKISGPMVFTGGTLTFNNPGSTRPYLSDFITVPEGQSGVINYGADRTDNWMRALAGSGTLTVINTRTSYYLYRITTDFSGFSGVLRIVGTTGAPGPNNDTARYSMGNLELSLGGSQGFNTNGAAQRIVPIGALSGDAGTFLRNGNASTWQIGSKNVDTLFSGTLLGGASLEKVGTGMIELAGESAYTGTTAVSGGALLVSGHLSGTGAVTVAFGAVLGGSGTVAGAVTFESGAILLVTAGAEGTPAALQVGGAVTTGETLLVSPYAPGVGELAPGTYPVLQAAGGITGSPAIAWAGGDLGGAFSIVGGNTIQLVIDTPVSLLPAISSALTASGTAGAEFSYAITASNSPDSFTALNLPTGLSLDPRTGVISGIPMQWGSFDVTISAANPSGADSKTLVLDIAPPAPEITGNLYVSGMVGVAFNYTITASNAPESYGAENLPGGLSLDPGTGIISGTPMAPGVFDVAISATNETGAGTAMLRITVADAPLPPPTITGELTASGTVGMPFSYAITAANNPLSYNATGLPEGLSVNTESGIISGTPASVGTRDVTISAANGNGSATAVLAITIVGGPAPEGALIWTGATDNNWDASTPNWNLNNAPAIFTDGNDVSFDETSTTGTVAIPVSVTPASVTVDIARDLVLAPGTSAGLAGNASIVKRGPGKLIFSAANTGFTGTTTVEEGVVQMYIPGSYGSPTIGSMIVFAGGTLTGNNWGATASLGALAMHVPEGQTGVFIAPRNNEHYQLRSTLTGSGTLTFQGGSRRDLYNAYGGFSGELRIVGGSTRIMENSKPAFANTTLVLDSVALSFNTSSRNLDIGAISGTSSSGRISGASGTYCIGFKNIDTSYAGSIEGADSALVKVGTGMLTLTGTTAQTTTIVESGALNVSGTFTGTGTVMVSSTAAFGGSGSIAGAVAFADGATLLVDATRSGTIATLQVGGAVTLDGTLKAGLLAENVPELVPGTYAVLHAAGGITGAPEITWTSADYGGTFSIAGGNTIQLVIDQAILLAPVITGELAASGTVGMAFEYAITAGNNPTRFSAANLPAGLSLDSTTGIISGVPMAAGVIDIVIEASNASGSDSATLQLTIAQPAIPVPAITSELVASGTAGALFAYTITAENGPTEFGAENLPEGLSVDTGTGIISGVPGAAGVTEVTVIAINATGPGSATLIITIAEGVPVITSPLAASGTAGVAFNYAITAKYNPASYDATSLPDGLSVDTTTGIISGVPTTKGDSNVTLYATNITGTGTVTLAINIAPPPAPVITSALTATGTTGEVFSHAITADYFPTSFGAENLPAGLSVDPATGIISGTPTIEASTDATVSATNETGTGYATLVITVLPPPPVITGISPPSAHPGAYLTITGLYLHNAVVTVDGIPAQIVTNTGTVITAIVPLGTGGGVVAVTTPGGVGDAPRTFAVVPDSGETGVLAAPAGIIATAGAETKLYVSDMVLHTVQVIESGTIRLLAGMPGVYGLADGEGSLARFSQPRGLAINQAGALIVADASNNSLRSVTMQGAVSTTGTLGPDITLAGPADVAAYGASGETYIADTRNHLIKKITASGEVHIVAGSGVTGTDNGALLDAKFNTPSGIAVDVSGAHLYVADSGNHSIRLVNLASGSVSTFAGQLGVMGMVDGDALAVARFASPSGLVVDGNGDVFVADTGNSRIREISSSSGTLTVRTLAGDTAAFVDGSGSLARFSRPGALALADDGSLYVADTGNGVIRHIATDPGETVTTLVLATGEPVFTDTTSGTSSGTGGFTYTAGGKQGGGGGAPSVIYLALIAALVAWQVFRGRSRTM